MNFSSGAHRCKRRIVSVLRGFAIGCLFLCGFAVIPCFAAEIVIVFSGETHAMLYPCSCPKEADGGIARRATRIKELRKNNPHALVLDAGSFFAGGLKDEYAQNDQLDRERTLVSLKAMGLMGYDAACIGDDEFNFGREFLTESTAKAGTAFLSCNIALAKVSPYLIKQVEGIKVGIIGVSDPVSAPKAGGVKFSEPQAALKKAAKELKKKGVDIIVLLSQLSESESLRLIGNIEGIDVMILGRISSAEEPLTKAGNSLVLKTSWQGRRLGRLSLTVDSGRITGHSLEQLRLSDEIADDPDVLAILPRCFSDGDCRQKGLVGACEHPGTLSARCVFSQPAKVSLSIIRPKDCKVCDNQPLLDFLKAHFPGLVIAYLDYPGAPAEKLIADFGIKALPAYFFESAIERERGFPVLKDNVDKKGGLYMLKPQFSGFAYFLDRSKIEGKMDLFVSFYEADTAALLEAIRGLKPSLHFLAFERSGEFEAAKGNLEVEEYLRAVCVNKYCADNFWDYIICRSKDINNSWWQNCLSGQCTDRIKGCVQGEEGRRLLGENTAINKELGIMFGPTYLMDNQEIFSSRGVPVSGELKEMLRQARGED